MTASDLPSARTAKTSARPAVLYRWGMLLARRKHLVRLDSIPNVPAAGEREMNAPNESGLSASETERSRAGVVSDRRKWLTLAVVGAAFFMTVLDAAVVIVALPSIGRDLKVGESTLQWIVTAYVIVYGGFLLLGGRTADLLGRRRIFLVGLSVFTLASLFAGLAGSMGVLIGARAAQRLGAAIVAPTALSIVLTTFEEGAERNKALGIWGALGGSGAAFGVLMSGVVTKYLGWQWIFFVNLPVGALIFTLTPRAVHESRAQLEGRRRFDAAGAIAVTSGLALLVYALTQAPGVGWSTIRTIGLLTLSAALFAAFLAIEWRSPVPLMPFSFFRNRSASAANVVIFFFAAAVYATLFLLTLYVQQVLGWSVLRTGLTFFAIAGSTIIWAGVAQALVTRLGPRPVATIGLLAAAGAILYFSTTLSVQGHYWPDLLPAYLVFGLGMAFAFVAVTIAALEGVEPRLAGLASGVLNTTEQVGFAVGVAVASTIFMSRMSTLLGTGVNPASASASGLRYAFFALGVTDLAGAAAAVVVLRGRKPAPEAALMAATCTCAGFCSCAPALRLGRHPQPAIDATDAPGPGLPGRAADECGCSSAEGNPHPE